MYLVILTDGELSAVVAALISAHAALHDKPVQHDREWTELHQDVCDSIVKINRAIADRAGVLN